METDLFAGIPDLEEKPGLVTLWHRPTKRHKWVPIGTAPSRRELSGAMDQVGGGEFYCLPAGQEPGPNKQL